MSEIAIIIKTFYRENSLINCLSSIKKYMNNMSYRLYIADDGKISSKKQSLYNNLKKEGHLIKILPYNTSVTKARNLLIDNLDNEKYILRLDDDFELYNKTNISLMKKILEHKNNLGAIADLEKQIGNGKGVFSGQINKWQGKLIRDNNILIKKMIPLENFSYQFINEIKYAECDFSRNMLLIKRELFDEIRWDENIIFKGEHLDFLLQLKHSKWNLAFTTNSIHKHNETIDNPNEDLYIHHKNKSDKDYLYNKWNFKKIVIKQPFKNKLKSGLVKIKNLLE